MRIVPNFRIAGNGKFGGFAGAGRICEIHRRVI